MCTVFNMAHYSIEIHCNYQMCYCDYFDAVLKEGHVIHVSNFIMSKSCVILFKHKEIFLEIYILV